jgi:hypothetical protein
MLVQASQVFTPGVPGQPTRCTVSDHAAQQQGDGIVRRSGDFSSSLRHIALTYKFPFFLSCDGYSMLDTRNNVIIQHVGIHFYRARIPKVGCASIAQKLGKYVSGVPGVGLICLYCKTYLYWIIHPHYCD